MEDYDYEFAHRDAAKIRVILNPALMPGKLYPCDVINSRGELERRKGYCRVLDRGDVLIGTHKGGGKWVIARRDNAPPLTPEERRKQQEEAEEARKKYEAGREADAIAARDNSLAIWNAAEGNPATHPYLIRKGVPNIPGLRRGPYSDLTDIEDALLVPAQNIQGEMRAVQAIAPHKPPNGRDKHWPTGCITSGLFHPLGPLEPGRPLLLCEGIASAGSTHTAMRGTATVICCFSCGNLEKVARALVEKYPWAPANMAILADNDAETAERTGKNPGVEAARKAAEAVGCRLLVLPFPGDANDVHLEHGLEVLEATIGEALRNRPLLNLEKELEDLAHLPKLDYERTRKDSARRLDMRISALDKEVEKRRPGAPVEVEAVDGLQLPEPEPWPDPVDGAELVQETRAIFRKHVVLQEGSDIAMVLWVILTYVYNIFRILPLLCVYSPEKRCGKTTTLTLLTQLCLKALPASNITAQAIYRTVEKYHPTLIMDEYDTFQAGNDGLRGIINSGHTKDTAFVVRLVGDDHNPTIFRTWGPKAIGMIGEPPGTIADRSIPVHQRRKRPDETVKRLPMNIHEELAPIASKIQRWADDNGDKLKGIVIDPPACGNDRAVDNWIPLLTIAKLCGDEVYTEALRSFDILNEVIEDDSAGVMILREFQELARHEFLYDGLFSKALLSHLLRDEDLPWHGWNKGNPIKANQVAKLLRPFGIQSQTIRRGQETAKGYKLAPAREAFRRYLTPTEVDTPCEKRHNVTTRATQGLERFLHPSHEPTV